MPENPRLLSLGMNGTRSAAEAIHLYGKKPWALARGVFISKESAKLEKERSFYHSVKRGELREG
jgi:hypothetical protein